MKLDDIKISRAIIESYHKKLLNALEVDVAIVGAGPAGMACAYYLAKAARKSSSSNANFPLEAACGAGG